MMQIRENLGRNIFSKVLVVCGFIMFALIFYCSFHKEEAIYSSTSVLLFEILATICVLAILSFLVNRFLTAKQFLILLVIISFSIRILWIILVKTMPISDFDFMYEAAKSATKGDFSFVTNDYFTTWGYQLGFTYYEAIVIKLFGDHLLILKLFNIFFGTGTSLFIYLITKKVFNEYSARAASLLYTIYIPNIVYSSVLTNQYISTFFFFGGLYFLLSKGLSDKYSWVYVGLMLAMGNIMRPAGIIFIAGITVFILIFKILPFRKKESFNYTKKLVGVLMVYFLLQKLIAAGLMSAGLADNPLSNQEPYWKFVLGVNYQTTGGWNIDDQYYVNQFKLGPERNKAEISLIKERLKDKKQDIKLFRNKFVRFWSSPDDAANWAMGFDNNSKSKLLLMKYEKLMYIGFCLFALGTISLFKRNNELSPLLYILLGGYVFIHLFVEVQTRYRFDILPVFFILVGYGVFVINQNAKKLISRPVKSNEIGKVS
jgi:4-amino-4-deoxy-L-arabinose transferase-like glycosyltransferase